MTWSPISSVAPVPPRWLRPGMGGGSWPVMAPGALSTRPAAAFPNKAALSHCRRDANCAIPAWLASIKVEMLADTIRLVDAPDLDYWDVDPAWDGVCFRSAMQARRPNRSGEIPLEIKLPAAPTNVCVRAVTIDGQQIQLNV